MRSLGDTLIKAGRFMACKFRVCFEFSTEVLGT
jgi:hypothetical protein